MEKSKKTLKPYVQPFRAGRIFGDLQQREHSFTESFENVFRCGESV